MVSKWLVDTVCCVCFGAPSILRCRIFGPVDWRRVSQFQSLSERPEQASTVFDVQGTSGSSLRMQSTNGNFWLVVMPNKPQIELEVARSAGFSLMKIFGRNSPARKGCLLAGRSMLAFQGKSGAVHDVRLELGFTCRV